MKPDGAPVGDTPPGGLAEPSATTERPKARSAARVIVVLSLLLAAVLGIFAAGYFHWVHHDRVAAFHLPDKASFIVRLETEQAVTFEPVRRFVFPVLDRVGLRPGAPGRLQVLRSVAGVDLALELREILVAGGPGDEPWVLVVAGLFPRAGVIEGLHQALTDGRRPAGECLVVAERLNCLGLLWAQAEDGALVVSASPARLTQALRAREPRDLPLPADGVFGAWLRVALAGGAPPLEMSGRGTYHEDLSVRLESQPLGGEAAAAAAEFSSLRARTAAHLAAGGQLDIAGERAVLGRLVQTVEQGRLAVELDWPLRDYERGIRALAARLEREGAVFYPAQSPP